MSSEVKAAWIAGTFVLLSVVISQSGIISDVADALATHQYVIYADKKQSGTEAVAGSMTYANMRDAGFAAVGEDSSEQPVKATFLFHIGGVPGEIKQVDLRIPCILVGNIQGFGNLRIHLKNAPPASNLFLDNYFDENKGPFLHCKDGDFLTVSGLERDFINLRPYGIVEAIYSLYFDGTSDDANGQEDGMIITSSPRLEITYMDRVSTR